MHRSDKRYLKTVLSLKRLLDSAIQDISHESVSIKNFDMSEYLKMQSNLNTKIGSLRFRKHR